MNNILALNNQMGEIIQFPGLNSNNSNIKTASKYKTNGVKKATKADPIKDPEDIKKIANYLHEKSLRDYCLFILGVTLGIRGSDLITLTIEDVEDEHIRIREQKTKKFNDPLVTPVARQALEEYLSTRDIKSVSEPLFASREKDQNGNPKPITKQMLYYIIRDAAKACNVKGHITAHSLRKTFAYQMLTRNKYDEEARFTLQAMLNHSDIRTTMIYAGLTRDKQDEMRIGLANIFAE